ncbi:C-type lectin domain family 4 member D-like [Triplophysa dalaica]|uniref:C-type lectin domain family 4 member D-like n=1 Tax=Triplophysa dalaica TaxID=1582913 RepID=UPI0024DF8BFA|nr:C-type lectin domain family 4 member D-like [Triplophysa dalaica]
MDWSCSSDRQLVGNTSRNKDYLSSCEKLIKSHPFHLSMNGWTAHDRNCYFFSSEKQTWFESRRSCEDLDAHLITINEEKEHVFIASHIKESFWIGLNDLDTEGRWVWVNNQTLNETGVQFWHKRNSSSEPDNWKGQDPSGENCVCLGDVLKPPNIWFDVSCRHVLKFICEKKNTSLFKDDE